MAKQIKKGINISPELNKRFDEMHPSKKDMSVSGAAAILLWIALEDMPGLREQLRKLGQGPVTAAVIRKVKESLFEEVVTRVIHTKLDQQIADRKTEFLLQLMQAKGQSSQDKEANG
jgi:hypothetical protein